MTVRLLCGDCRDQMAELEDNSVDAVVTDPPYGLTATSRGGSVRPNDPNTPFGRTKLADRGFMGKQWDTGEVAHNVEFWREVHRVHPLNGGWDRPWASDAEAVDRYHSTFEPATDAARKWDGWGTALKPANEPICMARKPLSEGTVAANILKWGTGAINIDGCRVEHVTVSGNLALNPHLRKSINGGNGGNIFPTETERRVVTPNALGRWPANIIHDGSEEVLALFPQAPGQLARARTDGYAEGNSIYGALKHVAANPDPRIEGDKSAARFFYNTRDGEVSAERRYTEQGSTNFAAKPGQRRETVSADRFFFNTSTESDAEWLARNLQSDRASDAVICSTLSNELAVSVLKNALIVLTPLWEPISVVCPVHFTSVTASNLKRISENVIGLIQNLDARCSPESLPARLIQSDNLASVVAIRKRIDIIEITASLWKSNGCADPATFNITLKNSTVGEKDCASRAFYCAKANKRDRAGSKHPTVKPIALIRYLCRLVTPPGGIVLDPFAGTGTLGEAAHLEGFRSILIEREEEYQADIRRRLELKIEVA